MRSDTVHTKSTMHGSNVSLERSSRLEGDTSTASSPSSRQFRPTTQEGGFTGSIESAGHPALLRGLSSFAAEDAIRRHQEQQLFGHEEQENKRIESRSLPESFVMAMTRLDANPEGERPLDLFSDSLESLQKKQSEMITKTVEDIVGFVGPEYDAMPEYEKKERLRMIKSKVQEGVNNMLITGFVRPLQDWQAKKLEFTNLMQEEQKQEEHRWQEVEQQYQEWLDSIKPPGQPKINQLEQYFLQQGEYCMKLNHVNGQWRQVEKSRQDHVFMVQCRSRVTIEIYDALCELQRERKMKTEAFHNSDKQSASEVSPR